MEIYSSALTPETTNHFPCLKTCLQEKSQEMALRCYGGDIAGKDKLKYTKQSHSQAYLISKSDSYNH